MRKLLLPLLATLVVVGCSEQPNEPTQVRGPSGTSAGSVPAESDFNAFPTPTLDDGGPNDAPTQSDLNSFTRDDHIAGWIGVKWTWDATHVWTGSGQTGDACALFDITGNGNANYSLCVRITNTPDGTQVLQVPGNSPVLYACNDKKDERCSSPNSVVPDIKQTYCVVRKVAESFPGQGDGDGDVEAFCAIDLSAVGGVQNTNLLNVCSYPSGSPGSNPFDCVITPGSGFLQIVKQTAPDNTGAQFNWTLNPASTNNVTSFNLTDSKVGDEVSALIAVDPTKTYSLTEVNLPAGWSLDAASCYIDKTGSPSTGTKSGNAVTGIAFEKGETTICTFSNSQGVNVTIRKLTNPIESPATSSFGFTHDFVQNGAFSLKHDETEVLAGLATTKYTIVELDPGPGFALTGISCSANNYSADVDNRTLEITPGAGETGIECQFTNTKQASVTIRKETIPAGSAGTFTFSQDFDQTGTFQLDHNQSKGFAAVPGTGYTVTETVMPSGFALTDIVCTGTHASNVAKDLGNNKVTVTPQAGESVTCTFKNTKQGSLTIRKITEPAGLSGSFSFGHDIGGQGGSFNLSHNGSEPFEVVPGTKYTIIEGDPTPAFRLTDISCTGAADKTITLNDRKLEVTPQAGENIECTFKNTVNQLSITVTKSTNVADLGFNEGEGLGSFNPQHTFSSNNGGGVGGGFLPDLCDDAGPNDVPDHVDMNCMSRTDEVNGVMEVKWTWNRTDKWTGSGSTGDACALLDTDNDGNANIAVCARVSTNPSTLQPFQVPANGHADVYLCNDTRSDRCANKWTLLPASGIGTTSCTLSVVDDGFNRPNDPDTQAHCYVHLQALRTHLDVPSIDLVNVCSVPSGQPNSNPFDCVVRAGAGFLQLVKVTSNGSTVLFGFTTNRAATNGSTKFAVAGGVTSGLIAMDPTTANAKLTITETMPVNSGWELDTVSCIVDGQATGTKSGDAITGVDIKSGQTTVCTFTNTGSIAGPVEFTITVKNNSPQGAKVDVLDDDVFGSIFAKCPLVSKILAPSGSVGDTYTCVFTETLTDNGTGDHENEVTAEASDDYGNTDTKKASVTVKFGP